ncbi:MAG: HlyD family type I secretion periplasmic adaptor subunit [Gammaproteobacteria bacterium]|nr:HlyD family type I secretion periplasmic adaptor subunit [Gammaproteobacteria bacterium]
MSYDSKQIASGRRNDQDIAYMRSLSAAVVQRSPRYLMIIVFLIAALIAAAIAWMNWAQIDVVIRGNGKVVPARQVQLIQSLEGGVVSEILVKEGDQVGLDQPLLKISDIAFSGSFEENRLLYNELKARSARLQAEASGEKFVRDAELGKTVPALVDSEQSLYESNAQQLKQTLSIYEEQISQHKVVLQEAQSKQRQLRKSLDLVRQEITIKEPLMQRRIISEIDFLQLQQREAELEGELESVGISIPRIRSTANEARRTLEQNKLDFRNKAKLELNQVSAELSRLVEAQAALQDRVRRTTLRSPVEGVVQRLYANTVGGVVTPGGEVIEIVPSGDALIVEVRIKPADIAYISVGQKARIKFSAYDFAIHGSVEGVVSLISADTITDEEGVSYYVVKVVPDTTYVGDDSSILPIKVGMTSEADIITAKKTILEYLLKPIYRGLNKAAVS